MSETEVQDQSNESAAVVETTAPVAPVAPVEKTVKPEAMPVTTKPRAKYGHYAAEAILVLAVIVLALQVVSAKSDIKNLQTQLKSAQVNPQALVQKQSDDLIARVAALMKLPVGETPTVAAVSDAAAAAKQSAFFANAQNGDKVLMYVKAGEAILYRPTSNKIILVAPLTFNNAQATTPTATPPVKR